MEYNNCYVFGYNLKKGVVLTIKSLLNMIGISIHQKNENQCSKI